MRMENVGVVESYYRKKFEAVGLTLSIVEEKSKGFHDDIIYSYDIIVDGRLSTMARTISEASYYCSGFIADYATRYNKINEVAK
jgi:hypothetical protein